MRLVLPAAKCCQMINPKGTGAQTGTGSGGDRCWPAVLAMIDATYKIGPHAKAGESGESLMLQFTEWEYGGDIAKPSNGIYAVDWIKEHSGGAITVEIAQPTYNTLKGAVQAGHVVIAQVRDYRALRLANGGNPYQWNTATQPPAGHALLFVGFDDAHDIIIVHDPLRADPSGQPADYSLQSISEAGWYYAGVVEGPNLLGEAPPTTPEHIYVVRPGDFLSKIAAKAPPDGYGDGDKWPVIFAANKDVIGSNPDVIRPGMRLVIPAQEEVTA